MAKETITGKEIIIHFDGTLCIHSRNCVLERPDVFVPNVQGEWIFPDRATPEEVRQLALNCSSGAISYEMVDRSVHETLPIVNTVRIRENGPLALHADIRINEQEQGTRKTLCRCGLSKNKPYCDGNHANGGVVATGEPLVQISDPLTKRNGELSVTPLKDGPLAVKGPLEVVSGTGHTINRTEETYLCRCGHSKNKPYCDGSHAKVGFKAD